MRMSKATVLGLSLGLCAATLAAWPAGTAQAATAANTLVVNAGTNLRPVTHVASGALYGLSANGTPAASLVDPLRPSSFVQMAPGGKQLPNGEPVPAGDALVVAPEAAAAGATVIVRMPDWYPNFPYRWVSWSDWLAAVDKQIASVKASGARNIGAYELWNEPDWTWNTSAAGSFDAGWVRTFREVRSKDTTTPIDGPSISFYSQSFFTDFLNNAKANNALPDIVSWHELGGDTNIAADVAAYRSLEASLGISRRPIVIEEYATRTEVGVPGSLVGYIAKFERAGVRNADLPFWNQYGTMGDTLVSTGGARNAAWWLYKWYGDNGRRDRHRPELTHRFRRQRPRAARTGGLRRPDHTGHRHPGDLQRRRPGEQRLDHRAGQRDEPGQRLPPGRHSLIATASYGVVGVGGVVKRALGR